MEIVRPSRWSTSRHEMVVGFAEMKASRMERQHTVSVRKSVPILTYHSLDNSGSAISTPPETFRQQMRTLHEWGFRGIRLSDLLEDWAAEARLSRRPVVLTFDDGFENVLVHAAPLLSELGFGATMFAVAGYCGKTNDWPAQPATIPRMPLLSWSGLRDLVSAGFELGSHTITHPVLTAPEADAKREIVESKRMIEDGVGHPVTVFAYPYGLANRDHRDVVMAHYHGACGAALREARKGDDRHWLPRVEMYYLRNMSVFHYFGTPLGHAYLVARSFGRGCRAALESCGILSRKRPG